MHLGISPCPDASPKPRATCRWPLSTYHWLPLIVQPRSIASSSSNKLKTSIWEKWTSKTMSHSDSDPSWLLTWVCIPTKIIIFPKQICKEGSASDWLTSRVTSSHECMHDPDHVIVPRARHVMVLKDASTWPLRGNHPMSSLSLSRSCMHDCVCTCTSCRTQVTHPATIASLLAYNNIMVISFFFFAFIFRAWTGGLPHKDLEAAYICGSLMCCGPRRRDSKPSTCARKC